jgi:hypothetical protein
MTCEVARERIAARWVEVLAEDIRTDLADHLESCSSCRDHAQTLDALWVEMGSVSAPEPGPRVPVQFRQMLEAYRMGAASHGGAKSSAHGRMLMQFAAAAAMLVLGVAAGSLYTARGHDRERIATLSADVQQMRQLVAVSLLRQPSAVERLRGVGFSRELDAAGVDVTEALFDALNHDSSVNVRLSAIDALRQVATQQGGLQEVSLRRLRQSILSQDSPLVQMAMIDWAVEAKDPDALRALLTTGKSKLDPAVSMRLAGALDRIQ